MTFDEKEKKILENRGTALLGYAGALASEVSLLGERDFNNEYLFGDGSNIGIINILELYATEMHLTIGQNTTSPASLTNGINQSKNDWIARFNLAASSAGDGEDGFYPPSSETGLPVQEMNKSTPWLVNNGLDDTTDGGLISLIQNVIDVLGIPGALGSTSQQKFGTGVIGSRYYDNFPIGGISPDLTYGNGTYDIDDGQTPTYEDSGGAFKNSINTLKTAVDNYKTFIADLKGHITDATTTNELFTVVGMNDDINNEVSVLETLETNLGAISTNLGNLYTFFNGVSDFSKNLSSGGLDYNLSVSQSGAYNFADNTIGIRKELSDLTNYINARVSAFPTNLPNGTSSGPRKWLLFWIKENLNKPTSPYVGLSGITSAKSQAVTGIINANFSLETLFGSDRSAWISQPNNTYAFQNNVFNPDTGELITRKNSFGWVGPVYINKAIIYRREISAGFIPNNDTAWVDDVNTTLITVNTFDPETGIIPQIYTEEIPLNVGEVYLYRVQVFDAADGASRNGVAPLDGSGDSGSLQSKIYDDTNTFTFTGISNGVFTFTDADDLSKFSGGSFVAILGTTDADGIYRIENIVSKTITLVDKTVNTANAGNVSKVFGVVSIDV